MIPIRGVYEVAIRVSDLARAENFYCKILGLKVGLRDEKRNWLFLRAADSSGIIVLQEDQGTWPAQHLAFSVSESEIEKSAKQLHNNGISVEGPLLHDWIPARSVYFEDPDGHALELCAVLPESV